MKKSILIIVILSIAALCFAGPLQEMHKRVIAGSTVAAGAGVCTKYIENSDNWGPDDYEIDSQPAQALKITSTVSVCKVVVEMYTFGGDDDYHIEFWTDNNMAGAQIGGDSSSETVTAESCGGTGNVTFTWTSGNEPELTSDCYMHIVEDGDAQQRLCVSDADMDGYEDTNYDLHLSGSDSNIGDLFFELHTLQ
jgi:hypothetical protein